MRHAIIVSELTGSQPIINSDVYHSHKVIRKIHLYRTSGRSSQITEQPLRDVLEIDFGFPLQLNKRDSRVLFCETLTELKYLYTLREKRPNHHLWVGGWLLCCSCSSCRRDFVSWPPTIFVLRILRHL